MSHRFIAVLLLAACLPALAQPQGDARAAREREALRRAQAALQQTQAARDAALAAQATAEQSAAEAAAARDALQRQLAAARAEAQALREQLERAGREREADAARAAAAREAAAAEAAQRDQGWRQQLAQARREADERTRANAALTALLEQRTAALADARRRVAELHALGIEAVDRYLAKDLGDLLAQREPVFGLSAVAAADRAEDLRMRLDALRLPPPPATP